MNKNGGQSQLKSLITDGTIRVNEKGKPAYTIENYSHIILLSNQDGSPIAIDQQDRRTSAFRTNSTNVFPTQALLDEYYNKVNEDLEDPGVARWIFEKIVATDLDIKLDKPKPHQNDELGRLKDCYESYEHKYVTKIREITLEGGMGDIQNDHVAGEPDSIGDRELISVGNLAGVDLEDDDRIIVDKLAPYVRPAGPTEAAGVIVVNTSQKKFHEGFLEYLRYENNSTYETKLIDFKRIITGINWANPKFKNKIEVKYLPRDENDRGKAYGSKSNKCDHRYNIRITITPRSEQVE
jgi:hypothetical protein